MRDKRSADWRPPREILERVGFCLCGAVAGDCEGALTLLWPIETAVLAALVAGRSGLLIAGKRSHLQCMMRHGYKDSQSVVIEMIYTLLQEKIDQSTLWKSCLLLLFQVLALMRSKS